MYRAAVWAFFIFTVFESYLTNMPAAAGHFNADDFAAVMEINPVVIDLSFVLVVHDRITPLYIVANPNIALDQYGGNPCLPPFKAKKRYLCWVSVNWLKNIKF
jgi:hypothetical protein